MRTNSTIVCSPAIAVEAKQLKALLRPALGFQQIDCVARTSCKFSMQPAVAVNVVNSEKARVVLSATLTLSAIGCNHFQPQRQAGLLLFQQERVSCFLVASARFKAGLLDVIRCLFFAPPPLPGRKFSRIGLTFCFSRLLLLALPGLVNRAQARFVPCLFLWRAVRSRLFFTSLADALETERTRRMPPKKFGGCWLILVTPMAFSCLFHALTLSAFAYVDNYGGPK